MELTKKRCLTSQEENLLEDLIARSNINISLNWKEGLWVSNLNDGGIGSLSLYPSGVTGEERDFGCQASECQFKDLDGVVVLASLYLDTEDQLYELDMWKTDFSPLKEMPEYFQDIIYSTHS